MQDEVNIRPVDSQATPSKHNYAKEAHMLKRFSVVLGILLLMGFCINITSALALEKIVQTNVVDTVFKYENLVRVADNVVILLDTSSSMNDKYLDTGMNKLQATKDMVKRRAELFPDVFPDLNVGLYSVAPGDKSSSKHGKLQILSPMQPFHKVGFLDALSRVPDKGAGPTLLQTVMMNLEEPLSKMTGKTVVFLFTDGRYEPNPLIELPSVSAKRLAEKYNVSFHLIAVTDVDTQVKMMDMVASINESSRVYSFDALRQHPEVFSGAVVVIQDAYLVLLEETDEVVGYKLDRVLFDFNMSAVKDEYTADLDAAADMLKANPDSYIILAGFTDNHGEEEYNLGLSHRRAEAVRDYLVKAGVDSNQAILFWYGADAPVASNDTVDGRSMNRRVSGLIGGVAK